MVDRRGAVRRRRADRGRGAADVTQRVIRDARADRRLRRRVLHARRRLLVGRRALARHALRHGEHRAARSSAAVERRLARAPRGACALAADDVSGDAGARMHGDADQTGAGGRPPADVVRGQQRPSAGDATRRCAASGDRAPVATPTG